MYFKLPSALAGPKDAFAHTPKILIQFLDPLLYPLKARTEVALADSVLRRPKLSKGTSREIELLQQKQGADGQEEEDEEEGKLL